MPQIDDQIPGGSPANEPAPVEWQDTSGAYEQAKGWIDMVATAKTWAPKYRDLAYSFLDAAKERTKGDVGAFWLTLGVLFDKADEAGQPAAPVHEQGWGKLADAFYAASTASKSAASKEEAESFWEQLKYVVAETAGDIYKGGKAVVEKGGKVIEDSGLGFGAMVAVLGGGYLLYKTRKR